MSRTPTPVEQPPIPDAQEETQILLAIMTSLEKLNKDQRARVLRYARDFFNVYMGEP